MDGTPTPPDDDDFKIKGAAEHAKKRKHTAPDTCTICLEPITERAVAAPCNHLTFDFLCLVSWLQEQSTCPLCKATVIEVQYDWRGVEDWKTYRVPTHEGGKETDNGRITQQRRRRRTPAVVEDPALTRRRYVYTHRLCSLHVGTNPHSTHTLLTPTTFSASPTLQSRARTFLRRELQVFPFLADDARQREFLMEYIVAILRNHEVKGAEGKARELLGGFLGEGNARLLLHELEGWLRGPWERLGEWDEAVQYDDSSVKGEG